MFTQILPPTNDSIEQGAALIREGQLVVFPTETVYGLGANAMDVEAVARIFEAKGRPGDNPLIAHIAHIRQLRSLIAGEPSENTIRMMEAFWPGPLTMIFPRNEAVPENLSAGLDTVAVRLPAHPVARALIMNSDTPIAAPSANRSGRPSPTTAQHVFEDMDGRVPLIIDGGSCKVGLESTVVDMTGDVPRILRPGGITAEMIAKVTGSVEIDPAVLRPLMEGEHPRSPGMKYRHYAPAGDLTIVTGDDARVIQTISGMYDLALEEGHRPMILALDNHMSAYGDRRLISLGGDEEEMAQRIFAALRDADKLNADVLLSEAVEAKGLGLAVMNRLGRAAAFHIIEV